MATQHASKVLAEAPAAKARTVAQVVPAAVEAAAVAVAAVAVAVVAAAAADAAAAVDGNKGSDDEKPITIVSVGFLCFARRRGLHRQHHAVVRHVRYRLGG